MRPAAMLAANSGWPVAKAAPGRRSSSAISSRSSSMLRTSEELVRVGLMAGVLMDMVLQRTERRAWARHQNAVNRAWTCAFAAVQGNFSLDETFYSVKSESFKGSGEPCVEHTER